MIVAIPRESADVARAPSAGSGPPERIVTQPTRSLAGKVKEPVKVAPASSTISSPGWAKMSAAWRSPPAATLIVCCVTCGNEMSTSARGRMATLTPDTFEGQRTATKVMPANNVPAKRVGASVPRTCLSRSRLSAASRASKIIGRSGRRSAAENVSLAAASPSLSNGKLPKNGTPAKDIWSV